MNAQDLDVLIVGAGLSGIGAAYHLQAHCPTKTYALLEARERLGGTWDLFRYPGIRSDSDMFTLGYSFRPWTNPKAIADGPAILEYLKDVARDYGIDRHIRYQRRAIAASWSSEDARWTVTVRRADTGEDEEVRCKFLYMCSGYYNYDHGHEPDFPHADSFEGRVVHPQHWPEDLDYAGKRVVIIGSGATAVTLLPSMAETAAHVTMLQRSPTYIAAAPGEDRIATWLRSRLPEKAAYAATRVKNVAYSMAIYAYCRRFPERAKRLLVDQVRARLGEDYDVETHFTPRYDPWDQRVCLAPDGDFFHAIKRGDASVVTDTIERFTPKGILLRSGEELEADIIVSATGLEVQFLGNLQVTVDGERLRPSDAVSYKGMMASGVPNLALAIGYTNASWTLKVDLTSLYVCRLLNHMDAHGHTQCVPRHTPVPGEELGPLLDLTSGYVQRALEQLPKQGAKPPWRLYQNYLMDNLMLRFGRIDDGVMEFSGGDAQHAKSRASSFAQASSARHTASTAGT